MKRYVRPWAVTLLAVIAALAVAACGGSSSSSSSSGGSGATRPAHSAPASVSSGGSGGTVSLVMGTAPQSLDPAKDYTTQGAEANWIVYTGLTTYAHANGTAGTKLIPGLATALPTISDGGKTYTATLRKGLKFSNGTPVKATDFVAHRRAGDQDPVGRLRPVHHADHRRRHRLLDGKAKTISGITADDATGKITIHLIGAVRRRSTTCWPSRRWASCPTGTPMKDEPTNPPPGVGPYKVTNIVPNQSFSVVKNPEWTPDPGDPVGSRQRQREDLVERHVQRAVGAQQHRRRVRLGGHDPRQPAAADPCQGDGPLRQRQPRRLDVLHLPQLRQSKPFNNQLAREAVVTGLNQDAMNRLGSGTLAPGCYFLPAGGPGSSDRRRARTARPAPATWPRPRRWSSSPGMAGQPVTVWSETRSAASAVDGLLHVVPELDRVQGHAEGDRRRDVLHDDRRR